MNHIRFYHMKHIVQLQQNLLQGCEQHWKESINRIIRNQNYQVAQFRQFISKLFNIENLLEFNSTIREIVSTFPNTKNWRCSLVQEHSSFLFPIQASPPEHLQGIYCSFILYLSHVTNI